MVSSTLAKLATSALSARVSARCCATAVVALLVTSVTSVAVAVAVFTTWPASTSPWVTV